MFAIISSGKTTSLSCIKLRVSIIIYEQYEPLVFWKGVGKMLKNLRKRYIVIFTLALLVLATGIAFAAGTQGQISSMSGQVVYAIATGARVTEGTVLVKVKTLAGAAAAARANCSGTVVSVVSNGSNISAGQTVAQIQP